MQKGPQGHLQAAINPGRRYFFTVYNSGSWPVLTPSGLSGSHSIYGEEGPGVHQSSFARQFYMSWPWIKCARAYKKDRGGLCERCLAKGLIVPGREVHHKIKLTPENISDPSIALNWDNLELLCKDCHIEEHSGTRWRTDELGHIDL